MRRRHFVRRTARRLLINDDRAGVFSKVVLPFGVDLHVERVVENGRRERDLSHPVMLDVHQVYVSYWRGRVHRKRVHISAVRTRTGKLLG